MLEVKGFVGYRFANDRIDSLDDVITPPFDVINLQERAALAARSPYNTVHLILPEAQGDCDRYEAAARHFADWIEEGIQVQDSDDSLYLLEQCFTDSSGTPYVRRGFFAAVKIPDAGENTVLGHEQTFPAKIKDRLALTRATQTNFGAVFSLYADPDRVLSPFLDQIGQGPPDAEAQTIDSVSHRLWKIAADPAVTEFFRDRSLYIADGHHRFATAVAYRDEVRKRLGSNAHGPHDYILMGLVDFEDPGLRVYPAHRMLNPPDDFDFQNFLEQLEPYFTVTPSDESLSKQLAGAKDCSFGLVVSGEQPLLLTLKSVDRKDFLGGDHSASWRDLDVSVLHAGIIEKIMGVERGAEFAYEPDAEKALSAVARGEKRMVFLMNPATPQQIRACADAGEFMPQKATYLFPKLPTGGVFHRLV